VKKEDLVDLKTAHEGLTVCKYKKSNWGPVAGFRALIIIIAKRLVCDVELEKIIGLSHSVILFIVSFSFVVEVIFFV